MNEWEGTLLYSLTSNLARSAKSVGVRRYSVSMKSAGTFGDEELQEALAKEAGADSHGTDMGYDPIDRLLLITFRNLDVGLRRLRRVALSVAKAFPLRRLRR